MDKFNKLLPKIVRIVFILAAIASLTSVAAILLGFVVADAYEYNVLLIASIVFCWTGYFLLRQMNGKVNKKENKN